MKTLLTIAALAVGIQIANAQTTGKTAPAKASPTVTAQPAQPVEHNRNAPATGTVAWSEETWDFGTIPQGIPVTHEFKFTNRGSAPVVISKVDKSCGCTTPKWTAEPVMAGEQGHVTATFNAAAAGAFNKTVTVHTNTGTTVLYIKGTVKPKDGTPVQDHSGHNH